MADEVIEQKIEEASSALRRHGPLDRGALKKAVAGQTWGPDRFRFQEALDEAVAESGPGALPRVPVLPPSRQREDERRPIAPLRPG